MQDRKPLTNILLAGTLTLLVFTVYWAFRGQDTAVADSATTPSTITLDAVPSINLETTSDVSALQEQVNALQAQNEELRALVTVMQERESEYQAQIEAANETIESLSAQGSPLALGEFGGEGFARGHHAHDGFSR